MSLGCIKDVPLKTILGWTQWLMPLILELWEGKAGDSLEVKRLRASWPTW